MVIPGGLPFLYESERKSASHKQSDIESRQMAAILQMRQHRKADYPIWQAMAQARRRGALSRANKTILTSPLGLIGQGQGQRKTLLGQ